MPPTFGVGLPKSTKVIRMSLQLRLLTEVILICELTFKLIIMKGGEVLSREPRLGKVMEVLGTSLFSWSVSWDL